MSEKRLYSYDRGNNKVLCNLNDVCDFNVENVFKLLNSLSEENEQLRKELQEKQEDEKLYANEILELNKTKKEMLNFKQLGGDY